MSILIVDDSQDGRLVLYRFLESAGHVNIVSAHSAEEAFHLSTASVVEP